MLMLNLCELEDDGFGACVCTTGLETDGDAIDIMSIYFEDEECDALTFDASALVYLELIR